ncbi:Uncharacterized protein HZ326_18623 [Fusarium oxysporum f. sp. albedinis]|nr:Uncharacterized protein HZ326_18623 [Fusarium oxysporum f. sp. albedinis]
MIGSWINSNHTSSAFNSAYRKDEASRIREIATLYASQVAAVHSSFGLCSQHAQTSGWGGRLSCLSVMFMGAGEHSEGLGNDISYHVLSSSGINSHKCKNLNACSPSYIFFIHVHPHLLSRETPCSLSSALRLRTRHENPFLRHPEDTSRCMPMPI